MMFDGHDDPFFKRQSVSSTNGFTREKPYKGHDLDQNRNERSKQYYLDTGCACDQNESLV